MSKRFSNICVQFVYAQSFWFHSFTFILKLKIMLIIISQAKPAMSLLQNINLTCSIYFIMQNEFLFLMRVRQFTKFNFHVLRYRSRWDTGRHNYSCNIHSYRISVALFWPVGRKSMKKYSAAKMTVKNLNLIIIASICRYGERATDKITPMRYIKMSFVPVPSYVIRRQKLFSTLSWCYRFQ